MPNPDLARPDAWRALRELTPARIALGRAGGSVPTAELLDFELAHARARDAVHAPFDAPRLARDIESLGLSTLRVTSAAADRDIFLKRPDLGRRLDANGREAMLAGADRSASGCDLAIVVSDGLSALAAARQVAPLLAAWLPLVAEARLRLAPVTIVERGRVAIEDEIGELLAARVAVILIGERPGLGSPDSLGAYLVYGPRVGRTDADRNCVSNIRPQGLAPEAAALKVHYLVREALARGASGIALKDESIAISRTAASGELGAPDGGAKGS
ncbi:MAG: ethanolamine ammonia-lyase subunit EutC [Planctomycetia bacterium]|nr:ethanolamine ammonia-lyase subunit EutC [Planctomycetia bacterium]